MDDAWLHIFHHLRLEDILRCRRISRRHNRVVRHYLRHRHHLDIEVDCPSFLGDPDALGSFIEVVGPSLTCLNLSITPSDSRYSTLSSEFHVTSRVIQSIAKSCPNLEQLIIHRMILTLGALEKFGELRNLKVFRISTCLISCSEWELVTIIRSSFEQFIKRCARLKSFEISGHCMNTSMFYLDTNILMNMADSIEDLVISVSGNIKIDNLTFLKGKRLRSLVMRRSFISSHAIDSLVDMKDTISHLDLSQSPNLLDITEIGKLHKLRILDLSNNRDGVDDKGLISIITGCTLLNVLNLNDCNHLTKQSLLRLDELKQLESLSLSGIRDVDDSICDKISRCAFINSLNLNLCSKISNEGLKLLLSNLRLRHLEVLGIRSYSHQLISSCSALETIICDLPLQHFRILAA